MEEDKRTFYSTGISVYYLGHDKWGASADFWDRQLAVPTSVEGNIHTRYHLGLRKAIEQIKSTAERFGIQFEEPRLYLDTTYEDPPQHPDGKALVEDEAQRLGWTAVTDGAVTDSDKREEGE